MEVLTAVSGSDHRCRQVKERHKELLFSGGSGGVRCGRRRTFPSPSDTKTQLEQDNGKLHHHHTCNHLPLHRNCRFELV
ncbi:hypothetical protein L1987_39906 [Smallanthus sonchifolius]|uniref:Uncharacterized protein n=1 Tax=Smallanthus sonchifolius TaxID=185202 RepID=A0ACB9GS40_9ASTR|nr:hypothetical protein L1987_39906 [Smallanthus sonchifolius]